MIDDSGEFGPQKQWSFGYDSFGNEYLPAHLLSVSAHHARSAVSKAQETDPYTLLDAAIHAGGAVELLAKFFLANVNPVLIVDLRKIQNAGLLQVLGLPTSGPLDPRDVAKVATKGPVACLDLLKLMTGVTPDKNDIDAVFAARNTAIHFGLMDRPELQAALAAMVRIIEALLEDSNIERRMYWGGTLDQSAHLAKKVDSYSELRSKLAEARHRSDAIEALRAMADIPNDFAKDSQDGFDFEALSEKYEYGFEQKCPACSDSGVIFCVVTEAIAATAFGESALVEKSASGVEYACNTCGLRLNEREMGQLGLSANQVVDWRNATEDEIAELESAAEDRYISDEIDRLRGR